MRDGGNEGGKKRGGKESEKGGGELGQKVIDERSVV